jgi:hypothetical protein
MPDAAVYEPGIYQPGVYNGDDSRPVYQAGLHGPPPTGPGLYKPDVHDVAPYDDDSG